MTKEELIQELSSLPPQAQRMVAEYVAFLKKRYADATPSPQTLPDLCDDEFIGIWSDRDDMKDSTEWVRHLRRTEWG